MPKQRLRPRVRVQLMRADTIDCPAHGLDEAWHRALSDPIVNRIRTRAHTLRSPKQSAVRCGDAPGITQIQVSKLDYFLRRSGFDFGGGYGCNADETAVSS
jgi:hypothetical protein